MLRAGALPPHPHPHGNAPPELIASTRWPWYCAMTCTIAPARVF
jgi:hypothetical protein